MSDSDKPSVPALSIAGGTVVPGLTSGLIGLTLAIATWPRPEWIQSDFFGLLWCALAGALVCGLPAFVIGGILAWHGGIIGSTTDRGEAAPLWGIVTGGVLGISLGPVFGAVVGLAFGLLATGSVLGLVVGPLAGVLAWELAYWSADYLRSMRHA